NILLDAGRHVYLADFGLTRRLGEPGVPLGAALSLGTPAYVAPEQIRGDDVDGRADVYSLGCLLYECLAGRPPFAGTAGDGLSAHAGAQPPHHQALDQGLARALGKSPDERYATCAELVHDAREAVGLGPPARDRRVLALAAVGVALIAAAIGAFFATRGG